MEIRKIEKKKLTKEQIDKQIKNWKARDSELVTGIFKFLENRGGTLEFRYKMYDGDDFIHYVLTDGERYQIPRGVARHLNNNCYYKEYKHMNNELGNNGVRQANPDGRFRNAGSMQVMNKVHRTSFQSLEFMDEDLDMQPSNLAEVSQVPLVG